MKVLYLKNNTGYTLVELLVAIMVGIIVIVSASATYIAQNRSYVTQESVSEINTEAKIAMGMILNDIRSAAFGAPRDLNEDPINGLTSVISFTDSTTSEDAITIVSGFSEIGALQQDVAFEANTIKVTGAGAVSVNDGISIDGVTFARVTSVSSSDITLDRNLPMGFPLIDTDGDGVGDTGRPVYLISNVTYTVNANGTLTRNGVSVADNIEDLQFAYAVDANGDGQIDDQNASGDFDAGDFLSGNEIGRASCRERV